MKVKFTELDNKLKKFQEGGEMAPEAAPAAPADLGAPAGGGGEDPMQMLLQGAALALQSQDCNIAMQVCQMLVQLAQGGAPAPAEGAPVYRKGGILSRRVRK